MIVKIDLVDLAASIASIRPRSDRRRIADDIAEAILEYPSNGFNWDQWEALCRLQ